MKVDKMVYKRVEMHESEAEKIVDAISEVESSVRSGSAPPVWVLDKLIELRDKIDKI